MENRPETITEYSLVWQEISLNNFNINSISDKLAIPIKNVKEIILKMIEEDKLILIHKENFLDMLKDTKQHYKNSLKYLEEQQLELLNNYKFNL